MTYLDAANLQSWLASRGLLGERRIVQVTSMSGRAFASLVELDDASSLFLKQPTEAIPPVGALREGQLLRLLTTSESLQGLRHILPKLIHFDETDNVTVTEGLSRYRTLRQVGVPPLEEGLLRETASRLATLHTVSAASASVLDDTGAYHALNPVMDFERITPADFACAPGNGFGVLLSTMQSLSVPLRTLRESWRPACIIHGDFRDDNVMVGPNDGNAPRIAFIDWELGGWGEPHWDLGALIGQFLYYWVESIKPGQGGDFASWVRSSSIPFSHIQRASQTLLASYFEVSGRAPSGPDGFLDRVIQLAGVFLFQRVLGSLESVGHIHAAAFYCLHVGRTLVGQPERAKKIIAKELA